MIFRRVPIVASSYYRHPVIGPIRIKVVPTAMSVRARWVGQELLVTVPGNYPAEEYERFLASFAERILAAKPKDFFTVGQIIDTPECDFEICIGREDQSRDVESNWNRTKPLRGKEINYFVLVRPSLVSTKYQAELQTAINRTVLALATHATRCFVVPRGGQLAAELDLHPRAWDVKHNKSRLGCCTSRGEITLGSRLIFLPQDLRDYVILHELAHLTEMNHSARFHELCNRYCGGHERTLRARLKTFRFPVF